MSEETDFIVGDSAIDATAEGRRGLRRRRRKERRGERVLTHCENCGAELVGEWCARCGQHAVDYRRSLWHVLVDAADSFLNWDTKFLSSVLMLLMKPWKLTNDFNAGKRARYVHPLRLYLLASIAFFLMIKLVNFNTDNVIQLDAGDRAEIAGVLGKLTGPESTLTPEQQATVESVRTRLGQGTGQVTGEERDELQKVIQSALASKMKDTFAKRDRAELKAALRKIPRIPAPPESDEAKAAKAQVAAELAAESAAQSAAESAGEAVPAGGAHPPPVAIPSPPVPPKKGGGIHFQSDGKPQKPFEAWLESRVKNKVGEDGTKSKLFLETLRNNIPTMMLCCIPLFALVLKVLYMRKGRYYVEHLVYALHIHTFAYVGVTVITLIAIGLAQWSNTARVLFCVACGIAMFVLVFLSIRRVYGEGWFFTTLKFLLGSLAYFVILVVAVGATAFITLLLPE